MSTCTHNACLMPCNGLFNFLSLCHFVSSYLPPPRLQPLVSLPSSLPQNSSPSSSIRNVSHKPGACLRPALPINGYLPHSGLSLSLSLSLIRLHASSIQTASIFSSAPFPARQKRNFLVALLHRTRHFQHAASFPAEKSLRVVSLSVSSRFFLCLQQPARQQHEGSLRPSSFLFCG